MSSYDNAAIPEIHIRGFVEEDTQAEKETEKQEENL